MHISTAFWSQKDPKSRCVSAMHCHSFSPSKMAHIFDIFLDFWFWVYRIPQFFLVISSSRRYCTIQSSQNLVATFRSVRIFVASYQAVSIITYISKLYQVISRRISHVFPHLLRAHHFRQCPTLCPAASPSMMGCQPLSCRSALKRRQVPLQLPRSSEAARERRNHNGTKILKRTEADHSLTTVNGDFNGDLMVI